jgi:hypothetical protein
MRRGRDLTPFERTMIVLHCGARGAALATITVHKRED